MSHPFFVALGKFVETLTSPGKRKCVCQMCVNPHVDKVVGAAGDYSLCARCRESITSETGVEVLERAL